MPDLTYQPGDHPVAVLAPDAHLVVDDTTNIVLVTPERRITVTNVANWREQLGLARIFAQIYQSEANDYQGEQ